MTLPMLPPSRRPSRLLQQAIAALCCLPLASSLALAVDTPNKDGADGADTTDTNKAMFTLGTVAVYGQRPAAAEEAESAVERETITLLEKKDVGTALALVPGVIYNRPQGSRYESSVVVRGYSLRDMPIFVDGIPVYIPYNGFSDLGRFTTADTSSIQVAKGYSSVMYGHNTRGGAINVVTLRPRSTLDANATLGAATGDVREFATNVGTRQDQWYLQTGVSYLERGYTRLADHFVGTDARGRAVDSDRYDYMTRDKRGSVRVGFTPNEDDEYTLSLAVQKAVKRASDRDGGAGFAPTIWEWPSWDRKTLAFVSNTRFGEHTYLKPRIYLDKFENTLDWWRGFPRGNHYDDKAFGASVELGTEIVKDHLIKLMVSLKDEEHREFSTDVFTRALIPDSDEKVTQKFLSVALEDTWAINEQWETQIGAIYTKRSSNATDVGISAVELLEKYPQTASRLSPSMDTFDPQAALFWKYSPAHTFRFSVAQKTRFPGFQEAYSNYGAGSETRCLPGNTGCTANTMVPSLTLQNPGMKPEDSMHYDVGYVGTPLQNLHVEAGIYLNRAKNAFQRTDFDFNIYPGFAVRQYINLNGVTERRGLDIGLRYSLPTASLGFSYAYLSMRNKDDPAIRFTSRPRHAGMAWANIQLGSALALVPSLEYRSNSHADSRGNNQHPGYALTNLKLTYRPPSLSYLSFNVGAENLFNKDYRDFDGLYPSPGRSLFANVRIDWH